jgi:hypothetical protein
MTHNHHITPAQTKTKETDTALWLLMLHFYRHLLNILVKHECGQNLPLYYVSTYTLSNSNGSEKWKAVLRTHSKDPCRKKLGTYITLFWKFPTKNPCGGECSYRTKVKRTIDHQEFEFLKKNFHRSSSAKRPTERFCDQGDGYSSIIIAESIRLLQHRPVPVQRWICTMMLDS